MTTELKNYAGTFDKVTIKGNTLILRFHNGYAFDLKSEKPIILITAHECINIDSVYRDLARFESEEVDGLTIDNMADTSRIIIDFCWANDGSPYELCTEKVSVTYEQYNIDDYQEYTRNLEDSWRKDRLAHNRFLSQFRGLRANLVDQRDRLKKKLDFFSNRNDIKAAEIKGKLDAIIDIIIKMEKCEHLYGRGSQEKKLLP